MRAGTETINRALGKQPRKNEREREREKEKERKRERDELNINRAIRERIGCMWNKKGISRLSFSFCFPRRTETISAIYLPVAAAGPRGDSRDFFPSSLSFSFFLSFYLALPLCFSLISLAFYWPCTNRRRVTALTNTPIIGQTWLIAAVMRAKVDPSARFANNRLARMVPDRNFSRHDVSGVSLRSARRRTVRELT